MARISSITWVIGMCLAVTFAPQLRIWTWGPAMVFFSVSALLAIPRIWNESRTLGDSLLLAVGSAVAIWIAIRALTSPVLELAMSDLLLNTMAVSTFFSFRAAARSSIDLRIMIYGIALMLLASIIVIGLQVAQPGFSPIFPSPGEVFPAGFFAHYSYGATFLIAASLFVGAFSLNAENSVPSRIFLGLVCIGGAVAVFFTKSRGGILGMGAGATALVVLSLFLAENRKKRWFAPAVIIIPLLVTAAAYFFFTTFSGVLEQRGGTGEISGMLDSTVRLFLINIAVSCFSLHPVIGGGSRSFSWECFQFWDLDAMGWAIGKPEHVHNELLQMATDYGLVGVALLILFLVLAAVAAAGRTIFENTKSTGPDNNALRVGGLASLAGLFVQSNFEGIFRIPPGAVFLALTISACCLPVAASSSPKKILFWFSRSYLSALAVGAAAVLMFFGWKGTLVSKQIWDTYFSRIPITIASRIDAIGSALEIWPLQSLFVQRGMYYETTAFEETQKPAVTELMELAAEDFKNAEDLHPFDPETSLRLATTLDSLGETSAARAAFQRAVARQGEMESLFKSRRFYADHLNEDAVRIFREGNLVESLSLFEIANAQMEAIVSTYGPHFGELRYLLLRARIHSNKGQVLQEMGDFRGAESEFGMAATLPLGNFANYLSAMLYGKLAVEAWSERKGEDAMKLFLMAKEKVSITTELPEGVTPAEKVRWSAYLDQSIGYLDAANYKPSEKVDF